MPAFDHEPLTVSTVQKVPTEATRLDADGNPASSVDVSVETSDIRIRYDGVDGVAGSAVTATTGTKIPAGTLFTIDGAEDVSYLRMIRDTAESVDATVRLTYNWES